VPSAWLSASGDAFQQSRTDDRTGLSDITLRLAVNLYGAPALSLTEFPLPSRHHHRGDACGERTLWTVNSIEVGKHRHEPRVLYVRAWRLQGGSAMDLRSSGGGGACRNGFQNRRNRVAVPLGGRAVTFAGRVLELLGNVAESSAWDSPPVSPPAADPPKRSASLSIRQDLPIASIRRNADSRQVTLPVG
jgi:hypothetical protein